jgi:hypothetical protein
MLCVYLVNEEPVYIGILSFSLKTLRRYNPNIPVVVYYIQDNRKDSRYIPPLAGAVDILKDLPNDYVSFSKLCEELGVEVRVRIPKQKESYHSLHRMLLQEVSEETVLLLDGDTFIFGSIEDFPKIYAGHDFVATPNSWGLSGSIPGMDPTFKMFNSGVVLCQNGIFSKWMGSIGEYCRGLYDGSHPYSQWLWSQSPACVGREEFAATLFVVDNKLKYSYFSGSHVQMGEYNGDALVLHTLGQNWIKFHRKCFRKKLFKPILR